MKKIALLIILFILLISFSHAFGMDTDLYTVTNAEVQPNVMIMFDNSGSMNETVSGVLYDPSTTYPFAVTDTPNKVYYRTGGGNWNVYRNSIDGTPPNYTDGVNCLAVKTALTNYGFYTGRIIFSTSQCGTTNSVNLRTGNYMNYMQLTGGPEDRPKLGLAKGIIQSYVNTTDGVRFGAMIFNLNPDGLESEGGRVLKEVKDMTPENRSDLHTAIGGLSAYTWTPLAETLYEAGLYFRGAQSQFNRDQYNKPVQYASPVNFYCQKNYVIIITDGESTKDQNSILSKPPVGAVGDTDKDGKEDPSSASYVPYADQGSDYLDDVAYLLHENDFNTDMQGKQNVTLYTVGFTVNSPLLERAAKNGGGEFFYCHNAQEFIIAMQKIIDEILSNSTSYVAPVVPISQMEKTSAGDRMYLAMFKPTMKSFWKGNLKKYGIATVKNGSIEVGDILDATGALAIASDPTDLATFNKILGGAKSYWSSEADGDDVEKGGVGKVLWNLQTDDPRTSSRHIYTYLKTSANPTVNLWESVNAFHLDNLEITPGTLGMPLNKTTDRDGLINFIHGFDTYDENGNQIINERRDWILGSFIHSRPLVIHYESQTVVYVGANDGMIHAFDDATGEELWAFIPPSFLPNLQNLNGSTLEFFADGPPKAYLGENQYVLMFGLRRGGDQYIALDITIPDRPKFLWEISPATPGFGELGQTWSAPQIGKIKYGATDKWVAIMGGGYDENQDNLPVTASDTRGRAVYVVNISTGDLIWSYSNANDTQMSHCIPSDVARVDTDGNGYIDRLYVGDIGGRIWRFDIGDPTVSKWTGKIVFGSNSGTSDQRKIFYPPDVTLEKDNGNYEMLFFGTGDREHPKATNFINRLYGVKDKNPTAALTENDLVDVTQDLLQDPSATQTQKTDLLNALMEKNGWYIKLDQNVGEKCLSNPVVSYGVVYYTTFTPSFGTSGDVCFVGEGAARVYALKYKTGNAAFNLFNLDGSLDGALTRSDRSIMVGSAIPSGVIITFINGTAVGYTGVGGGVYKPKLFGKKSLVPVSWRIIF